MWEAAELWVSRENRTDTPGHEAEQANHQKFSKSNYKPGDRAELDSAQSWAWGAIAVPPPSLTWSLRAAASEPDSGHNKKEETERQPKGGQGPWAGRRGCEVRRGQGAVHYLQVPVDDGGLLLVHVQHGPACLVEDLQNSIT